KLDRLGEKVTPRITLGGVARVEAQLLALDAQLTALDAKRVSAHVGIRGTAQRLLAGGLSSGGGGGGGLGPLLGPLAAGGAVIGAGLAPGAVGLGVGG